MGLSNSSSAIDGDKLRLIVVDAILQQVDFSLSSDYILLHIFCRFDDGAKIL